MRNVPVVLLLIFWLLVLSVTNAPTTNAEAFGPEARVNDVVLGVQAAPTVSALPNGSFYVAWHDSRNQTTVRDYDIYGAIVVPGAGVSPSGRVNDDAGNADQTYPSAAVSPDGAIHLVWTDARTSVMAVFYSSSTDGETFAANKPVNASTYPQFQPDIAVGPTGDLHLAWVDLREGDPDIYYANSSDGGRSFGPAIRVDDDQGASVQLGPHVTVDALGGVWFAWTDYRNDPDGRWFDFGGVDSANDADVFVRCLCGGIWTPSRRMNGDTGKAFQAGNDIGAAGSAVAVVWTDFRNDADGFPISWPPVGGSDGVDNGDAYFTASMDGGLTFSSGVMLNDDAGMHPQESASVIVTDRELLVAWADARDGSWDIFHTTVALVSLSPAVNRRVHGFAPASAQFGPSVATGSGTLVAWTDNRSDLEMDVFAAFSPANTPPIAFAGVDVSAKKGDLVILDGRASSDPDGDTLQFAWTQVAGPQVVLEGADTPSPTFIPTSIGLHGFRLVVADGRGGTSNDDVLVVVWSRPPVVVLVARPWEASVGAEVILDGTASFDPDGTISTYDFDFGDGYGVRSLNGTATHAYSRVGSYKIRLIVTDSDGNLTTSEALVSITLPPDGEGNAFVPWLTAVGVAVALAVMLWASFRRRRKRPSGP